MANATVLSLPMAPPPNIPLNHGLAVYEIIVQQCMQSKHRFVWHQAEYKLHARKRDYMRLRRYHTR